MSLIIDYIKTLVPAGWSSNPSGWTSGNCPMCIHNGESRPDSKRRGGFRFESDEKFQYNCFNCGFTTGWTTGKTLSYRLKKLMMQLGAEESDIQRLQLELMQQDELAQVLLKKQNRTRPVVIDWPEIELPERTIPFMEYPEPDSDWISAAEYLHQRGFNIEDPRLMYTPVKQPARMSKRFVIPFTHKETVVGYTARWVGTPPEGMPKYYNKQPPKNFVYGMDRQTSDKDIVIVTEGILDAIVTDGVAIGSNNINEDQANIIDSLQKTVVLLPDADKAGYRAVNTALERGWSVSFPDWDGCKDAADAQVKYGQLFTVRTILDSAVNNSTKVKVLAQRYCK